jgi:lipopolysaccharide/colanic/teichoic acid biosynthesis glycosyltransferase
MSRHLASPTSDGRLMIAQERSQRWFYFACKRLLDVLVAASLLFFLAPLMVLLSLLIRLNTPGPAIFKQERVGLRRRSRGRRVTWEIEPFTFYKFRSMHWDSDPEVHRAFVQALLQKDQQTITKLQGEDPQIHKLVKDSRVTGIGGFLRKSSLDELPQLLNVLKGDMSLVGPRPPTPYEVDMYDAWHHRRLEAKPGMTGLWQVTARSTVDYEEMIKLDIEYIENQSFWLDFKILVKTPLSVFSAKGAV